MAGLAVPVIEFAGGAAARWLAGGAAAAGAGALAGKVAKDREEASAQTKLSTLANADARAEAKEKCKECPADKGAPSQHNVKGWSETSIMYQQRVASMPPAAPGFLTEWMFNGVEFDGFESGQCLLKEAKAGYDKFFGDWDTFEYPFQERIFLDMTNQAVRQNTAAILKPPVKLRWHFMEPASYRYMRGMLQDTAPQIEVVLRP